MHRFQKMLGAALACAALPPIAFAQSYPAKPIRMIVPFPGAALNDAIARAVSQSLSQNWGQPIVVENRAGANGNIGTDVCAKAAPDGYTLCMPTGVVISLNPFAYSNMPFDPPRDLTPVIHVGILDQVIAVNTSVPANSIKELLEYAKARPGGLNWASLGVGSSGHLYMEWVQAKTAVRFTHIPYKGSQQLQMAVAAGEVHVTTNTPGGIRANIEAGKVRPLAVVAGRGRARGLPDVPTFLEQGYDLDFRNWVAIFLPRNAPLELARRWNLDVNKLLVDPQYVEKYLGPWSVTAVGGTIEEFVNFMKRDRTMAGDLAKIANLKLD
ncbi:MAG: tripartite tricarboxylate transporter substrate binding protein [Betaproteobacteria bacterium]|nr:tripartite tricarboxylate transporter substrate binding protein [Betaproteobacteria bacterium]